MPFLPPNPTVSKHWRQLAAYLKENVNAENTPRHKSYTYSTHIRYSKYSNLNVGTRLTASFPGQPAWVSLHHKVKPICIFMKQEMIGWQWHQLGHKQIICIVLQTDNHASTSSLNFLQAGCSSYRTTNSVKALRAVQLRCRCRDNLVLVNYTIGRRHLSISNWTSISCRWQTRATRCITATCCKQRWTLNVTNLLPN